MRHSEKDTHPLARTRTHTHAHTQTRRRNQWDASYIWRDQICSSVYHVYYAIFVLIFFFFFFNLFFILFFFFLFIHHQYLRIFVSFSLLSQLSVGLNLLVKGKLIYVIKYGHHFCRKKKTVKSLVSFILYHPISIYEVLANGSEPCEYSMPGTIQ